MTRKDYIAIAATLARVRRAYAPHGDPNLFRACTDHANALADMFAADNARFDRPRFIDECGVPELAQSPYIRHVDASGRHWWINEGHPETGERFCICRALSDGGTLLHTAILERKDLKRVSP